MINGIINICKEEGYTSHDVVAKLRGILHQKRIGHTGTLDPMATGVLPVCLGKCTKLADSIAQGSKTYKVNFELGYETNTEDSTGEVVLRSNVLVNKTDVLASIYNYIGEIEQVPPMYSAIKINGKKLYEIARSGEVIERKTRKITIYDINDISIDEKVRSVTMTVNCSKGTYIRSLCRDIGRELGTYATMTKLVRTKVGKFEIYDAITIDELERRYLNSEDVIINIDTIFANLSKVKLNDIGSKLAKNGNKFNEKNIKEFIRACNKKEYMVYAYDDTFIGIFTKEGDTLSPKLMF